MQHLSRMILALALAATLGTAPAWAQTAPTERQSAIDAAQLVIEDQINAFLSDDAATAYSFAAPGIQALFPDPDRFFDMVRRSYAPVFRPGNFAFGRSRPAADGATIVQEVIIAGPGGTDWSAVYVLERQPDGSYRISGVQMTRSTSPQT
jgi:hypothetical protein